SAKKSIHLFLQQARVEVIVRTVGVNLSQHAFSGLSVERLDEKGTRSYRNQVEEVLLVIRKPLCLPIAYPSLIYPWHRTVIGIEIRRIDGNTKRPELLIHNAFNVQLYMLGIGFRSAQHKHVQRRRRVSQINVTGCSAGQIVRIVFDVVAHLLQHRMRRKQPQKTPPTVSQNDRKSTRLNSS